MFPDKETIEAIEIFGIHPSSARVEAINNGLINSTFKVFTGEAHLLLQKLNRNVFTNPSEVVRNYNKLFTYLVRRNESIIPAPIRTVENNLCFTDFLGNCWRATRYIENSVSHESATSATEAFEVAYCFGNLTNNLKDFDLSALSTVIPGFHDVSWRYEQFVEAIRNDKAGRRQEVKDEIESLMQKKYIAEFYNSIVRDPAYKMRVMHHDAKITNVLFDNSNGRVICPIDCDTMQAGYYFSDLGDLIRTLSCTLPETSRDFSDIGVKKDYYQAVIEGYTKGMRGSLTEKETANIHFAGLLMTYMQSLRFLTDHINGDTYYRIDYPGQNYDRGKNQLRLLEELEAFLKN